MEGNGWTALFFAGNKGQENVAKLLLERPETDVNRVDQEGWNVLSQAANYGHQDVAALLLARDDIAADMVNGDGFSPPILASRQCHSASNKEGRHRL